MNGSTVICWEVSEITTDEIKEAIFVKLHLLVEFTFDVPVSN
jgi:hypothetical protein